MYFESQDPLPKRRSTMIKTDAFKAFTARARWQVKMSVFFWSVFFFCAFFLASYIKDTYKVQKRTPTKLQQSTYSIYLISTMNIFIKVIVLQQNQQKLNKNYRCLVPSLSLKQEAQTYKGVCLQRTRV